MKNKTKKTSDITVMPTGKLTKSKLLIHMDYVHEPIFFTKSMNGYTVTVYTYAKIYPEYTVDDILYIAEDLESEPDKVNFEYCYKKHVNNFWLKAIINKLKEGDHFYVSRITDLGGTPNSIISNLKKIKNKGVYFAIFKGDIERIELDFASEKFLYDPDDMEYSDYVKRYTNGLYPVLLELIQSRLSPSTSGLASDLYKTHSLSIADFSDDFIDFYFAYIRLKSEKGSTVGQTVSHFAKKTGISPSTVYKRIAWLNAHPKEVATRYDKIQISQDNTVDLENLNGKKTILFFNYHTDKSYAAKKFYDHVIALSKKFDKNFIYRTYPFGEDLFYYKITGTTSLFDILDFCIFYSFVNEITIKSIEDFYSIANNIVWEYTYPSKEINTKFNAIFKNGLMSYGTLCIQDIHHLGNTSDRIIKAIQLLIDNSIELSTPNLRLVNFDLNYLVEFHKDLRLLESKPDMRKYNRRPMLSIADLPSDFKSFYSDYRKSKSEHRPLSTTVSEYANTHNYAPKTVYSWIYRADRGQL